MGVKLSFFLALMVLLPHFHCLNWQATGTLYNDMQTTIWNYINTNFDPSVTLVNLQKGDKAFINFVTGLSTQLNDRFDRAWNVVWNYILVAANSDSVFYGYGFREHWMWYNGYKMNDGFYVSFTIWKDYNCQTYITFNNMATTVTSSFSSADSLSLYSAVSTLNPNWRWDDPWKVAFSFVEYLQNTPFKARNAAFSIIVTQTQSSIPFAYVCALKFDHRRNFVSNGLTTGGNVADWGSYILFQMR